MVINILIVPRLLTGTNIIIVIIIIIIIINIIIIIIIIMSDNISPSSVVGVVDVLVTISGNDSG